MKMLLIRAGNYEQRNTRPFETPLIHPPLGLLNVGASLEEDGNKVTILDFYAEQISGEKLKQHLVASDAVGISVNTYNYQLGNEIANDIKTIDSDIPIILGGPHCIFLQKQSLSSIPNADISVIGEGEITILNIVQFLKGKVSLNDIPGIYYRKNGSIKKGKPVEIIKNLDELPFPARHLVDKYEYGELPWGLKYRKKVTAMITSRGCPFHCKFCSRYGNIVKGWGFRQRSTANIMDEFRELNEKYKSVFIVDDNFLVDKKRAHIILDELIQRGSNIDIIIEGVRADSADRELYSKMKKAGVKVLQFGIESGNQDVLDFYDKQISKSEIENAICLAREMNFFIYASFIFGAPIETKEHIENTIKFACSLPIDAVDFTPLYYLMGSRIWKQAVKDNKISQNEPVVVANKNRGLGKFTPMELQEFKKQAFNRFYKRPTYLLSQLYRTINRRDFELLANGLKYIILGNTMGWNSKGLI